MPGKVKPYLSGTHRAICLVFYSNPLITVRLSISCGTTAKGATANDTSCIPESILSRFHVIHVSPPSSDEREIIIENVKYALMEEMQLMPKYHISLDPRLIDHYGNHSFRILKRLMRLAIDKRLFVFPENTDIDISKEEFDYLDTFSKRTKVGFI